KGASCSGEEREGWSALATVGQPVRIDDGPYASLWDLRLCTQAVMRAIPSPPWGVARVGLDCRLRAPGVRRTQMRTSLLSVLWIGLLLASSPAVAQHHAQTNLVSDQAGEARFTDAHLLNAWGLVSSPTSPWWVANNGTLTSTLYDGNGVARPLV